MSIDLREINGVKRFTFITTDLIENKTVEVVGVKDMKESIYHVVFYNKTDKEFVGYLTKSAKEVERSKNVVFRKKK